MLIPINVPPSTATVEELCHVLFECEKAQHRYQWASGVVLVNLRLHPEIPRNMSEFVEWLAKHTGLFLSQSEVRRRIDVYSFYSRFGDAQIIDLIEISGVRVAHQARRVIHQPDQARTVLQACINNPIAIAETLQGFGDKRRLRCVPDVSPMQTAIQHMRDTLTDRARHFSGKDWVPLSQVLECVDQLATIAKSNGHAVPDDISVR